MVSYCLDYRQFDELELLLMVRFSCKIQVQQQNVCDSYQVIIACWMCVVW